MNEFEEPSAKKRREVYTWLFISLVTIYLVGGSIWRIYSQHELDTHQAYTLGYLHNKRDARRGYSYELKYSFNGIDYDVRLSPGWGFKHDTDQYIYLRLNYEKPLVLETVDDIAVPWCISSKEVPKKGWTEIPDCKP